jgi:imidazolonepropionase-like amidohydrolase/Tol biopolymer transport system component
MLRRVLCLMLVVFAFAAHGAEDKKKDDKPKWDVNHPPGEKAIVPIDTHTGTWMTVDVSPDGKQLVFDLLGDLYTLPITGGEAKSLTHSIAWEMQARYSPDGKQIVYMSDAGGGDNIWLMDADGSHAHALTSEDFRLLNNPVWHPNGQYIAARKHFTGTRSLGSGEIWLYHIGGGKGVQLNEKPNWQKDLGEPAFSPDAKYIYFSEDATPGKSFQYNKDGNGQIFQILRMDLSDNKIKPFVSGPGGAVRPTPSPDGKYLAFVRRIRNQSTLFLKDLSTGREAPVWPHLERDLQETWSVHGVYPAFAWMPDSKRIVVWAQGKLWNVDPFASSAQEIAFHVKDTREIRKAVRFPVKVAPDTFDVKQLRWVNVSPDGSQVVYSALGHVYIRALPNGTPKRLTQSPNRFEFFPSFSRDGQRVAFVTWNDRDMGSVATIDVRTGVETRLTSTPGKYSEPRFSPDGAAVVYLKGQGGQLLSPWNALEPGVYVVSAAGSGTPRLIDEDGTEPQFGADNDHIYVTHAGADNEVDLYSKLVRVKLDRSESVEVAKSEFVSEFAVSPDGRWLAFAERYHSYVTPMPAVGKPISLGAKMDSLPVRQLDVNSGEYLHWSGDSKSVHFALADELFTTALKDSFAFEPGAPEKLPKVAEHGVKIGFTERADIPSAVTAITGARIVTMKGDEVLDDGVIVIRNNRIAAIGKRGTVTIPTGATIVDAAGKTIIPGIVDVHWHGSMGEDQFIPQQSWVNYASLAFGVTTLHDPSNDSHEIFTSSEMQRDGAIVGPRIFSTGTILYGAKAPFTAVIDNLDDALTHLKRQKAYGAISVKSYNQPRRDQRQQILEAARETGMMVVPEGASLFELNMTMVVDGHTGVEHALPVANVYDDVTQLWSHTQVGYTPTFIVAYGGLDGEHYWYSRTDVWKHPLLSRYVPRSILVPRSVRRETAPDEDYNVLRVAKTIAQMQHAGVPINLGAHGQREGLGAHWEIWTAALGGMTPLEALRMATLNGARYLGMDKDIGSLEVGKLADLAIIDGDVLADIRNSDKVAYVMVNGRLYESATMNELGATPKARAPFFFEGEGNAEVPVRVRASAIGDDD